MRKQFILFLLSTFSLALHAQETPPQDASTIQFGMYATTTKGWTSMYVTAATDMQNVWVKGISTDLPNNWVKGDLQIGYGNEGEMEAKIIFPSPTLVGTTQDGTNLYMYARNDNNPSEIVDAEFSVSFNGDNIKMLTDKICFGIIDEENNQQLDIQTYSEIVVFEYDDKSPHVPQAPIIKRYIAMSDDNFPELDFNLPYVDIDDNQLLPTQLFYEFFLVTADGVQELPLPGDRYNTGEDLTEINYFYENKLGIGYDSNDDAHFVVFPMSDYAWHALGVRSVYYTANDKFLSPISWYELKQGANVTEVDIKKINSSKYVDMQGRNVRRHNKGVYIDKENKKKIVFN